MHTSTVLNVFHLKIFGTCPVPIALLFTVVFGAQFVHFHLFFMDFVCKIPSTGTKMSYIYARWYSKGMGDLYREEKLRIPRICFLDALKYEK